MSRRQGLSEDAPRRYREILPPSGLAARVRCAWTLTAEPVVPTGTSTPASAILQTVPPDGCMDVIFDVDAGRGWFVGVMSRARTFGLRRPALLGVRFAPGGIPLLQVDAAELRDVHVGFEDALERSALLTELAERLAAAPERDRRPVLWAGLSAWCVGSDDGEPDPAVLEADRQIRLSRGTASVGMVAETVGLTERSLQRRYARHVGLTPKHALRVERVNTARLLVEAEDGGSLASIAYAAGYADQAHLTREFTDLLGRPPAEWRGGRRPSPVGFVQDGDRAGVQIAAFHHPDRRPDSTD